MANDFEKGKMEYLRTKVLTASPEELHLMLYDGAIRFSEEAKSGLESGNLEQAHDALGRAQNIVLEMSSGLDHEVNPELCAKMSSLYNFIYRRLVEANLKREIPPIDDALKILNYQRETWVLLMQKLFQERQGQTVAAVAQPTGGEGATVPSESGVSLSLSA